MKLGSVKARQFWESMWNMMKKGYSSDQLTNPSIKFVENVKKGDYDQYTDDEYNDRLKDVEIISSFYGDKSKALVGDIFSNALFDTNLSDGDMKKIVDILVEASLNTEYTGVPRDKGKNAKIENVNKTTKSFEEAKVEKASSIYHYLDRYIIGQDEAKKQSSILVCNHVNGHTRNLLLAGNTGCGKTEIWRRLSKRYDFIRIVNCPQISADGWSGSMHFSDIFLNEDPEILEHMIIVFDEFDKLLEPQIGSGGTDLSKLLQNELLKLMDGDTITYYDTKNKPDAPVTVDGSKISMVFCGSFATMRENIRLDTKSIGFSQRNLKSEDSMTITQNSLVEYANMRLEIAGRINRIVVMNDMTIRDYENIMNSDASPVREIEREYGVQIVFDPESMRKLITSAYENRMGCRYLRSEILSRLDDVMFRSPDLDSYNLSEGNCNQP